MKRVLCTLLSFALLLTLFVSCGQQGGTSEDPAPGASETSPSPSIPASSPAAPSEQPTPTPTPEQPTDMEILRDVFLEYCADELAGLESYDVTMSDDVENFPQMAEDTYGVDAGLITDGFVIKGTEDHYFEVVVLRMTDADAAFANRETMKRYDKTLWDMPRVAFYGVVTEDPSGQRVFRIDFGTTGSTDEVSLLCTLSECLGDP